jgi:hypothetical protein
MQACFWHTQSDTSTLCFTSRKPSSRFDEVGGNHVRMDDPTAQLWGRPDPDVVARKLAEETVLVHLSTGQIYRLNHTGGRLWDLLAQGCDRVSAENQLLAEFDVEPGALHSQVTNLIETLIAMGLVEVVD